MATGEKGKILALNDFLQQTTGSLPMKLTRKSSFDWADEVEEYYGSDSCKPVNVILPTPPKASSDYEDFGDNVPKDSPYISDISKGFGYVEYEDRDSLLAALAIPDITLKIGRITIEVGANSENDRRRGRTDMSRERRDRSESSLGDWLSGPSSETSDSDRRSRFNRDRNGAGSDGFNRHSMREERSFNRDNVRGGGRNDSRAFSRHMTYRGNGFNRDRDNEEGFNIRDRDGHYNRLGGSRDERSNRDQGRCFTRDKGNFRDSDRGSRFEDINERRDETSGFNSRRFDSFRHRNGGFTRGSDRSDQYLEPASLESRERPQFLDRDQGRGFTRHRGNFHDSDRGSRFENKNKRRDERRGFGGRRSDNNQHRNGDFTRGSDRTDTDSESASSELREMIDRGRRTGYTRDRVTIRDSDRGSRFEDRNERTDESRGFGVKRFDNDRDRNGSFTRGSDRSDTDLEPASLEPRERPKLIDKDQRSGVTRDRDNFRDSDRCSRFEDKNKRKDESRGFFVKRFDNDRDRNGSFTRGSYRSDTDLEPASLEPRERPKLILPRAELAENVHVKAETVPSISIFGNAKPVATSQRERQIEEKIPKEQSDKSREGSRNRKATYISSEESGERKNIERSRSLRKIEDSRKRNYDDKRGPGPRREYKSPEKIERKQRCEKPKKEDKRERHGKKMPKLSKPEPPNFAANNIFALLEIEDDYDYSDM